MEIVEYDFDDQIKEIAEKISNSGGRVYLVGGAVRDMLQGNRPHDLDFCITGVSEDEMMELFPEARKQGKSFPVFILNRCEFALARTERKTGKRHIDFEVNTSKGLTIEDDLKRRDITINAMALDVLSNRLVDPFGGKDDLKNGIIRKTSEAFIEDPLRVYRVARFCAKMGYKIAEDTLETLKQMKDSIKNLAPERVFVEFRKALLTDNPRLFFDVLRKADLLDVHFKEVADLIGVEQPIEYHPEGDVYNHTMDVLQRTAENTKNAIEGSDEELTRFCALVHDFGKALTPREEWPHHYGHEEKGKDPIHSFCKTIKAPKIFEKAGIVVALTHMKLGRYNNLKPTTKVKVFADIVKSRSISLNGVQTIARIDGNDEVITFAETAEKIMSINATPEMIEKCAKDGVLDYEKLKGFIHQQRVEKLKELEKNNTITVREVADNSSKNSKTPYSNA